MERDTPELGGSNATGKRGQGNLSPKSNSTKKGALAKVRSSSGPLGSSSKAPIKKQNKPKSAPLDSEQISVIHFEVQLQLSP